MSLFTLTAYVFLCVREMALIVQLPRWLFPFGLLTSINKNQFDGFLRFSREH